MVFRENWYEDLLKQLRQALAKCFEVAFSQRENVYNAQVTPQVMNFIRKVVSTLGSVESPMPQSSGTGCSADSKKPVSGVQDAMFQKIRNQFLTDFDLKYVTIMLSLLLLLSLCRIIVTIHITFTLNHIGRHHSYNKNNHSLNHLL